MCGITGKVYLNSESVDYFDIKTMNEKVAHRGPDDSGVYLSDDKKLGLGNQRLSIIDLSSKGHMPMSYKNKYFITYNGEVYNFKEQRRLLTKTGYKFQSGTDTEIILALYDKYQTDCLKYLRGMFAFAIYDKKRNSVFLARDRIGKKPLKYFFNGEVFIFASELKSILGQKEVRKEVDDRAIFDYLTFGYTLPPRTGFLNINKLEPGHFLVLDLNKKTLQKTRYWVPDYSQKLNLSEEEWQRSILHKLNESVKLRMVSDVPIGAFLSGGVDSSTVVALMAKNSSKPINTFTISFRDKNLDETKYADNIVKLYKTSHQTLVSEPNDVEILPELAKMYEEPFADASSVVTYMVSKLAKQYVKVVLNGDGGDENFVGYERFRRVQRDFILDKYFSGAKPLSSATANIFSKVLSNNTKIKQADKFLKKSLLPFSERYGSYIQYFGNEEKKKLRIEEFRNTDSFNHIANIFDELGHIDIRDKALYWDMTRYLPEDLLAKVDIASMAVGLEARSPFLDQEMVELACRIPFDLKYKNGSYKYILKKAIKNLIPDENVYRRKAGFTIPLDQWFEGSLNEYSKSILLNKTGFVLKIFNKQYIKDMLSNHSTTNDFGPRLWALLSLELWHKAYFT